MKECPGCDGSGMVLIEDCDCNYPDNCYTNCEECNP
jgi:hypothetical protein